MDCANGIRGLSGEVSRLNDSLPRGYSVELAYNGDDAYAVLMGPTGPFTFGAMKSYELSDGLPEGSIRHRVYLSTRKRTR